MFARTNRFSFKKGSPKRIHASTLFVIRFDKKDAEKLECAVVVGKKVDKRAVVRNKIKRELVTLVQDLLPTSTHIKLVIFAKKQIRDASTEEKKEELIKSFKIIQTTP